ncbi:MAG: hypothetical protein ACOX6Q_00235 [Candidatus Dojkabacteria bacterium]|jgi:hypothetical protein
MRKSKNIYIQQLLAIGILFLGCVTITESACYERQCVDWNWCCDFSWGNFCLGDSCCERYEDVEVPCPCDDSCNGSCTPPQCPSGYTETNPNNLCTNDTKNQGCSYHNDCGNTCGGPTRRCYRVETNTPPTIIPTTITIKIDNSIYQLSSDKNNPTRIPSPVSNSSPMSITILPQISPNPAISRGVGYILRGNNYGINNEWIAWSDCTNPRPEDYCKESTSNTIDIAPTSMTKLETYKPGAMGDIGAFYYTLNRCDDNKLYSTVKTGYYKVNTPPTTSTITFPLTNSTTNKGCKTTTHTGQEANNPLKVKYESFDPDGNSDIEAFVLWISKTNTSPNFSRIVTTNNNIDVNEIGIMIKKNNNSWTNTPLIYTMNTDKNWIATNNGIVDAGSGTIISIHNVTVNEGTQLVAQYDIAFTDKVNGMFSLRAATLDKYMFFQDGQIDQRNAQKYSDWGVDLVQPELKPLNQDLITSKEFDLSWEASDTTSNIFAYIINAYRTDLGRDGTSDYISMENMPNNITLSSTAQNVPAENLIGLFTDTNTWQFTNLNQNPYLATRLVNINNNELGTISLYGTAYDSACNYAVTTSQVRLDPWYATKGSILYSHDYPGIEAQQIDPIPYLRTMNEEILDKGTEILSSANQFIPKLTRPDSTAVRAVSITDSNLRKEFWFEYLKRKFQVQQEKTAFKKITTINECLNDELCYIYSSENINIPSDTQCRGKILVMSEKDIDIHPNIERGDSQTSGCIFFAANNVNIKEGTYYSSPNIVKYDYIDAFIVANNQIIIEFADALLQTRDGLEINGGLVAFGNNLNGQPAINMLRDLRLFNNTNPVTVLNYDYKFSKIATTFFGKEALLYKKEVGFKPL